MRAGTVDEFLEQHIDGYLLSDLDSVKRCVPAIHPGSAAYLMTAALCSGIEMLGYLLAELPQDGEGGFPFGHYCTYYLAELDERYKVFGVIGRELIRNGINHAFTTKPNIGITRQGSRSTSHLVRRAGDGLIIINPDFLLEDFEKSYRQYAKPRLAPKGDLRSRAEVNYSKLRETYNKEAEEIMKQVASKLKGWPEQQIAAAYTPSIEQITRENTFPTIS